MTTRFSDVGCVLGVLGLSSAGRITTVHAMLTMPIRIVCDTGWGMERMAVFALRHVVLATAARRRLCAMPAML